MSKDQPFNEQNVRAICDAVGRELVRHELNPDYFNEEDFGPEAGLAHALNEAICRYQYYKQHLDPLTLKIPSKDIQILFNSAERVRMRFTDERDQQALMKLFTQAAKIYAIERDKGYDDLGLPASRLNAIGGLDDEDAECEITSVDYREGHAIQRALDGIALLAKWAKIAKGLNAPLKLAFGPEHRLIGYTLPGIYEAYFGRKFGISIARGENPGDPSGPGIRFIVAVLNTAKAGAVSLGHFSPHTIAKYVKDYKAGNRRRQP
jgi:hypothetical protein